MKNLLSNVDENATKFVQTINTPRPTLGFRKSRRLLELLTKPKSTPVENDPPKPKLVLNRDQTTKLLAIVKFVYTDLKDLPNKLHNLGE